ncbi:MAG TPA: GAF domain-containing protein, partial [Thermoplasmatales archaeon]|nr:GAF domain-containing protein [Thermoplasmatales archaeon]
MDIDYLMEKLRSLPREKVLDSLVEELYKGFDHYNWVGIYVLVGDELVLHSWRGEEPTSHTRIPIGVGICGCVVETGVTEIIPDVTLDQRYLSCFSSTKSEIVVPIKKDNNVIGDIVIESNTLDAFNNDDKELLERLAVHPLVVSIVSELYESKKT